MISNCGHDENNRYSGGKAGDQTGTEWRVINWYNRPWKCVLRHPDAKVRKMIASMAKAAAVNNKIGYDQSERYTFWEHLKASNYDPAQITIACEADCSSGVAAIVKGAGYRLGNEKMKNVSIYLYTGNMRAGLKAAGFEVLTDSKYLTSDAYLLEGDITLNDNAHVAVNLTDGAKSSGTGASNTTTVKSNARKKDGHLSRIVDLKTEEIFKNLCLFLLLFYAILRTEVVKVTSQKVCFLMGDVIGYFFISKKYIRKF